MQNLQMDMNALVAKATPDDCKTAYNFFSWNSEQDKEYWATVSEPIRPDGVVDLEPLWQILVFACPIGLIVVTQQSLGWLGLMVGVPAALLWGMVMDRVLAEAINEKARGQRDRDRGRYELVRILSHALGTKPQHITLGLVIKLAAIHKTVLDREAHAKRLAKQQEAERRRLKTPHTAANHHDRGAGHNPTIAASAVAAGSSIDDDYVRHDDNDYWSSVPDHNPANGLPMIGGFGGVDVAGNAYGMDHHD